MAMAFSCPSPHARFSVECRPKLLKDFLQDDSPSYSYNAFPSHPLKAYYKSTSQRVLNFGDPKLMRSKSSRAASATISAIQKVINIVKFLPFTSAKSQSILPRRISRKLSRRNYKKNEYRRNHEVSGTVKVKDILRWKSSRDLVEQKSTPLDYHVYSPYRCTTTTATATTATTSTTTSSKRSTWCDSDFTAEELSCWCGEIHECYGKSNLLEESVGGCCMGETRGIKLDPKENLGFDENEQHSPVSVFESPFREDQEGYLSFNRTLVDIDRTKCLPVQRIPELAEKSTGSKEEDKLEEQEMLEIEEKAKQFFSHLKETKKFCMEENCEANVDKQLLLDFFWHEVIGCRNLQNNDHESEILMREAKSWMNGEYNGELFEWEIEDKREAYIRDMQRVGSWNYKFEEEKEELTLDFEFELLNDLVDEVLADHFSLNRVD